MTADEGKGPSALQTLSTFTLLVALLYMLSSLMGRIVAGTVLGILLLGQWSPEAIAMARRSC